MYCGEEVCKGIFNTPLIKKAKQHKFYHDLEFHQKTQEYCMFSAAQRTISAAILNNFCYRIDLTKYVINARISRLIFNGPFKLKPTRINSTITISINLLCFQLTSPKTINRFCIGRPKVIHPEPLLK